MKIFTIPDELIKTKIEEINFVNYQTNKSSEKNKIFFNQSVISFVFSGEKEIFHTRAPVKIKNQIAFINASNCLMTERTSVNGENYKALLIFFSNKYLSEFIVKYNKPIKDKCIDVNGNEVCLFPNDYYINSFRELIWALIEDNNNISLEFKKIKLEELFLYFLHNYPDVFCSLLLKNIDEPEVKFKLVVQNNILSKLKIEELAFLTNTSVSTFKRYFKKFYQTSPQKWFLSKRMEHADMLLNQGYKPSEIYKKVGYSTLSNFLKAYKKYTKSS